MVTGKEQRKRSIGVRSPTDLSSEASTTTHRCLVGPRGCDWERSDVETPKANGKMSKGQQFFNKKHIYVFFNVTCFGFLRFLRFLFSVFPRN